MESYLLVSDLDGTLLGDDAATAFFAGYYHNAKPAMLLAYSSGRFYNSQMESIRDTALPLPDAIIGGVGTDIRFPPGGEPLKAWHAVIGNGRWSLPQLKRCLHGFPGLELQPEEFQSDYKLSYYLYNATPETLAAIETQFVTAGLEARMVYSSNRDLDLLPTIADKGTAAAFLAQYYNLPPERVFVAGDTGNDLALFKQGFRGIVVANAHEELRALTGENVYQAAAAYANGVLEGLRYWLEKERSHGSG